MADDQEAPPLAAPPKPFPEFACVGVMVPYKFNEVIIAAAARNKLLYADQLLTWAIQGADCERQHEPKLKSGRSI